MLSCLDRIVLQTFKIALKSNVVAPDALRRNLDPIFKADLVKLTSDALFEKYDCPSI